MKRFKIGKRWVGKGEPVLIIAEAGVNHNGDIKLAHKLIDAAAEAGADAVKFQTFLTEESIGRTTPLAGHHLANVGRKMSHFELIKKLELPLKSFAELKAHCEDRDVIFLSTPYDIVSAEFLIKLGCDAIKIASSEMMNYPILDVVRRSKKHVLLSTGMSRWKEIVDSIRFVGELNKNICVLKCTSNYPASPASINLRGIRKLREEFPQYLLGFSDHSVGNEISLASLSLDMVMIERHFTLDKNARGPDHKASLTPKEMKRFVKEVRKVEQALGNHDWDIQDEETAQRKTMQKGVYARRNITRGERVRLEDVKFLRPLGKITPKEFFLRYRNRLLNKNVQADAELIPAYFNDKI